MVDDPRDAWVLGSSPVDLLAIGPFVVRRGTATVAPAGRKRWPHRSAERPRVPPAGAEPSVRPARNDFRGPAHPTDVVSLARGARAAVASPSTPNACHCRCILENSSRCSST